MKKLTYSEWMKLRGEYAYLAMQGVRERNKWSEQVGRRWKWLKKIMTIRTPNFNDRQRVPEFKP